MACPNTETYPLPEQITALQNIGTDLAAEQDKIWPSPSDEDAYLFTSRDVERVYDFFDNGVPIRFSTQRFLGRVSEVTPEIRRMRLIESAWTYTALDRRHDLTRKIYGFTWTDDEVLVAERQILQADYFIDREGMHHQVIKANCTDQLSRVACDRLVRVFDGHRDASLQAFNRGAIPYWVQLVEATS